jgi:hypothetical protein
MASLFQLSRRNEGEVLGFIQAHALNGRPAP